MSDAAVPPQNGHGGGRLTAAVDPAASPARGVFQGLRFVLEIVERVKLVGGRLAAARVIGYEQQVGGNPAAREPMGGWAD